MLLEMCKSKIHAATVTDKNINYSGSITIDRTLMDAAGIVPYEKVQVANLNNGSRIDTYVIEGVRDSGTICINGAAARCAELGDKVIIISYCLADRDEAMEWQPKIVIVDENNKIQR